MPSLNKHRPFHIYYGHTYFITARCYEQTAHFNTHERKQLFVEKFSRLADKFNIKIFSWSLLTNHYHTLVALPQTQKYQPDPTVLPLFVSQLHGQTASTLNQQDGQLGRKVWYQYWDYCIRDKKDFWKHFNYIVQQPLKHKIVKTLREAYDYRYSSNPIWQERFGEDGLSESFIKYPVKNWTPVGED